ncbi:N-acyl-D-amino-acid deacylase family protein [Pyrococcus abyssi]|uniref:D-aminoacylase (Aspartate, glutamate ETC) n=1 Tax=Pyrococcus abyssi (strain GE5 / Orsay) TaxID=272844 RepID=Q9V2D3_PYRAB|nr:amidohydrolase family protein [Pyrococcus abyssi]CAB49065.1 ndaD D-aminoacylase [Pyrococcus abyssi GE5]CCE69517.1 TPA: d-aminoacylase (aspartate, glutamate ETC) [Pyrococcus abyssi GE5]
MVEYDIVIKNGKIVDGTGNPWFRTDIGIKDGKIVKIGKIKEDGQVTIDASNLIVAPGFIDMHAHDDLIFFKDRFNRAKLLQGVTTVVSGNCGISVAPVNEEMLDVLKSYVGILGKEVEFKWRSYGEFLDALEEVGPLGTNFVGLVGHGTLRIAVMGMEARDPTEEELGRMKELLAKSMEEGAFGMSSGLIYPPGVYSKTWELIELAMVVAKYGGIYSTHMRDEGNRVIEALEEAIRIGRESGVRVEVSHHKVSGRKNWGKSRKTLALIEKARNEGIEITLDVYPYTAGSTYLAALLPPWVHESGKIKERCRDEETRKKIREFIETRDDWQNFIKEAGWENIIITHSENFPEFVGKSLKEISDLLHRDPFDVLFDILAKDGTNAGMIVFLMSEEDVERILSHPYSMIGTDGLDSGEGLPHPRAYGTFPRVLGRYVREKKLLRLEDAIRKMTSLPALKLGLKDRGLVKEGMWADLVIFDPHRVKDRATYTNPRLPPDGIKYVIVNGVLSVENGELTGDAGGVVIRRTS